MNEQGELFEDGMSYLPRTIVEEDTAKKLNLDQSNVCTGGGNCIRCSASQFCSYKNQIDI